MKRFLNCNIENVTFAVTICRYVSMKERKKRKFGRRKKSYYVLLGREMWMPSVIWLEFAYKNFVFLTHHNACYNSYSFFMTSVKRHLSS